MIQVERISKNYAAAKSAGGAAQALKETSLDFAEGKTTVLLGPSGCGKSTLLRIVLGLLRPDTGRVLIDGAEMTPASAQSLRHKIGYVIQDGGLFPHLTLEANVQLAGRYLKVPSKQLRERTLALCRLARIDESLLGRYPANLSGGQRQRVGIVRALMLDPPALLLDEPLGALDPITRTDLQDELKSIFQELNKTVVLVTHDLREAAYLGDSIALMRDGEVAQIGSMDDLKLRPADEYVARFLQAEERAAQAGPQPSSVEAWKAVTS